MTWKPISTAPTDGATVDIWSPTYGRLCNYQRVHYSLNNVFYSPVGGGVCCVRDATHWMQIPDAPTVPMSVIRSQCKDEDEYFTALRDEFAGLAMQGQMSIPDERTCPKDRHGEAEKWRNELIAFDAAFAYLVADAMLEARKKYHENQT